MTIAEGAHVLYMYISFKTYGQNLPKNSWVVNYTQAESKTEPGVYEAFTCAAQWVMDTTEADLWYIDNYIDELPWSEGGRTYAVQDVMEEIPEQMGDYLNPNSVFESVTRDKVMEKTTRKNRGREKLLGWYGS